MLITAAVYVFCAVSCPTIGRVFYIGRIKIDAEIKRIFYVCYVVAMAGLFCASSLVKKRK